MSAIRRTAFGRLTHSTLPGTTRRAADKDAIQRARTRASQDAVIRALRRAGRQMPARKLRGGLRR